MLNEATQSARDAATRRRGRTYTNAARSPRVLASALLAVLLVVCASSRVMAQQGRGAKLPSPEKIVGEYLKALGGKKRVAAVRDATLEWNALRGAQEAGRVRMRSKSPAAARTDFLLDKGEMIVAANARAAWVRSLEGGLRTLTDAEAANVKLSSLLDAGRLLDYKKQNVLARTVASEQLAGETAYVVEFATREGARLRYWFGANTKLLLQTSDEVRGQTRRFADYREAGAGGPLQPHRVEISGGGISDSLTLQLQSARYNMGLNEAAFDPPSERALDIPALLREVSRNQRELDERVSEYTYTRKSTEREINDRGEIKKEVVSIYEVYPVRAGRPVKKLVSVNGVALSPEDAAKEERRVGEELTKAERNFERREQKRERERAKRKKDGETEDDELGIAGFLRACEFVSPRRENFRGRETIVFDFRARSGFRPTNDEESIISKLVGVAWIDPVDKQVMRLEARLAQGIKVGGGLLASVRAGSAFVVEQTRIDEGVWLPRFTQMNFSVRVLLFAGMRMDATHEFSDYKRFTTKTGDATLDAPKKQ